MCQLDSQTHQYFDIHTRTDCIFLSSTSLLPAIQLFPKVIVVALVFFFNFRINFISLKKNK